MASAPLESRKTLSARSLLMKGSLKCQDEQAKTFWTEQCLKDILTSVEVTAALKRSGVAQNHIDKVVQITASNNTSQGYLKILGILILQEKEECIGGFIKDGVCDANLPLSITINEDYNEQLTGKDGQPIKCCQAWKSTEARSFCSYQLRFQVPFFRFNDEGMPIKYELEPGTFLPWAPFDDDESESIERRGGFGVVERFKMQDRSHGFSERLERVKLKSLRGGYRYFAVKKLSDKGNFDQEFEALDRLSGTVHAHLIALLTAYVLNKSYCLVFPFAECNLDEYLREAKAFTSGDIDPTTMSWFSDQIFGIMDAIGVLHYPGPGEKRPAGKEYGRHGDIKPENVLLFDSNDRDKGLLVISDLGLGKFNSKYSRSSFPNDKLPFTIDYRPPECDIEEGKISRLFDVWGLGCLFLEMVCWLLEGPHARADFEQQRSTIYIAEPEEGRRVAPFFDILKLEDNYEEYVITVKSTVTKKITKLHNSPRCTRYIHELLDLIQWNMLVVISRIPGEPKSQCPRQERRTSEQLREKMSAMRDEADKDISYITKPCPYEPGIFEPLRIQVKLNKFARNAISNLNIRGKLTSHDPSHRSVPMSPAEYKLVMPDEK